MNWIEYLKLDSNTYNCWTFVQKVSGKENAKLTEFANLVYNDKKSKWGDVVTLDSIDKFAQEVGALEVSLQEIKTGDLLLFVIGGNRPMHFGYYIGNNQFIHMRQRPKIDALDSSWRLKLSKIYRL